MVQDYKINGIIYHDSKTCPNNSNNRYGMPQRLSQKLGIPYVTIQGDLNDLRMYSEEQARTQIEALVAHLPALERAMDFLVGEKYDFFLGQFFI